MSRAIILMLDSLGIGGAPDADKFGEAEANTFGTLARFREQQGRTLHIPNLVKLGLAKASELSVGQYPEGVEKTEEVVGAYGACSEISFGKDTPSGHWEMAGVPVLFDFGYFSDRTQSFPKSLTDKILARANLTGFLGNCHSSGTEILQALGEEHMKSGLPILYTSSDSVFQIACHEETFGLERLYELCKIAREELADYNIGRVIARPFIGNNAADFQRTGNRHDYSLNPPGTTVLEKLINEQQGQVLAVGKIADIYAHQGISKYIKATGFDELYDRTLSAMDEAPEQSIIFTNFVDFDSSFGHRRDVDGYASALEAFDLRLPEIMAKMRPDDILYLTADHGCDPAWPGSDHTRERVPVVMYGQNVPAGSVGIRDTFADIGQTVAKQLGLSPMEYGKAII
ncbi:phosphopentomutase [Budvicia aquatica]|uniref:Phosphopentomutase n=2 Tax=Budvicia aquatica TaxID=82979 RepID=A0A2C6DBM8_9GAMM|nr:phosphopentomutase [Budvicia aquatica]PHI28616.1 phosphopentomutase [Budvicia aquatica]